MAAGVGPATATPTGRTYSGYTEYTVIVTAKPALKLTSGTYFMNVLPQCSNASDSSCYLLYWDNAEDTSPPHHFGAANIVDDSFFDSTFWGVDYGSALNQGAGYFDLFSFGLAGK